MGHSDELPSGYFPWNLDETLVRLGDRPGAPAEQAGARPPPPATGERYVPRGLLGEGGMGRVVDVLDTNLGRRVALKTLGRSLVGDPGFQRRFVREAQIQGQLDHPAVVPVHELGRDADGAPWFTMRKVHGQTLADVVDRCRWEAPGAARYSLRRLLGWFVQATLAVEYAHSRQVLHLDIKPSNVMVGEFGEVYLLDWGLARGEDEAQPSPNLEAALAFAGDRGSVGGTPGYMAPEQARGQAVDGRADVYALGCVLFELLTLEPMHRPGEHLSPLPLERRSPMARSPSRQVPAALDAIVVAATEGDPAGRTPSARALADAVERFLDGDRHSESLRAEASAALTEARERISRLDTATTGEHELAMHSVTKALALAPGHREARELLRQVLSASPPSEQTSPGSEEEHLGEARAQLARSVAVRFAIWTLIAPLMWLMGPRDLGWAAALTAGVACALGLALFLGRRQTLARWGVGALVAATSGVLTGASFLFGPFMVVPALGATAAVLFAAHLRSFDRGLAIAAIALAVFGPWTLEVLGALPPSMVFQHGEIHLLPRLVDFPELSSLVVLTLATASSMVMPAVLNGRLRDQLARAEARLRLSAWYLERVGSGESRAV